MREYLVLMLDSRAEMLAACPEEMSVNVDPVSLKMKSQARQQSTGVPFVSRSLWTSTVETCLEISRVLTDIFLREKRICIISAGHSPRVIVDFQEEQQSVSFIQSAFMNHGGPSKQSSPEKPNWSSAIDLAVEKIARNTVEGRIIFFTTTAEIFGDNGSVSETLKQSVFLNRYSKSKESPQVNHLERVHLDVVALSPDVEAVTDADVDPGVTVSVVATLPGIPLWNNAMKLLLNHFKLGCTIISNIPMKEEQQSNSSSNYDVELLHAAEAHKTLLADQTEFTALTTTSSGGLPAVSFKWLSPKLPEPVADITNCIGTYRISPLDVLSRHSTCLTNFLLGGRSVTLSQCPRGDAAQANQSPTHVITCHGGVIFLHILAQARAGQFELDTPSFTESPGGKVLDYRIADFCDIMLNSQLFTPAAPVEFDMPTKRQAYLDRVTKYFPLTNTLLTNLNSFLPMILEHVTKESLSVEDFNSVKKTLHSLDDFQKQNVSIPASNTSLRPNKKEDQYRAMWSEMEQMMCKYASVSPRHAVLHKFVLAYKNHEPLPSVDISEVAMCGPEELVVSPSKKPGEKRPAAAAFKGIIITPSMLTPRTNLYDVYHNQLNQMYARKRKKFHRQGDPNYSLYSHPNLKDEPKAT